MTTAHIFIGSTPHGQDAEFQMAIKLIKASLAEETTH